MSVQATFNDGSSAGPVAVHAAISRSGDVVSGGAASYPSKGEVFVSTPATATFISTQRVMLLNPSTTLQLMLRNATNGDDLVVSSYQITVAPLQG